MTFGFTPADPVGHPDQGPGRSRHRRSRGTDPPRPDRLDARRRTPPLRSDRTAAPATGSPICSPPPGSSGTSSARAANSPAYPWSACPGDDRMCRPDVPPATVPLVPAQRLPEVPADVPPPDSRVRPRPAPARPEAPSTAPRRPGDCSPSPSTGTGGGNALLHRGGPGRGDLIIGIADAASLPRLRQTRQLPPRPHPPPHPRRGQDRAAAGPDGPPHALRSWQASGQSTATAQLPANRSSNAPPFDMPLPSGWAVVEDAPAPSDSDSSSLNPLLSIFLQDYQINLESCKSSLRSSVRPASSVSMALICARIGTRSVEFSRTRARLACQLAPGSL